MDLTTDISVKTTCGVGLVTGASSMGIWLSNPGRHGDFPEKGCKVLQGTLGSCKQHAGDSGLIVQLHHSPWHRTPVFIWPSTRRVLSGQLISSPPDIPGPGRAHDFRLKCIYQQICPAISSADLLLPLSLLTLAWYELLHHQLHIQPFTVGDPEFPVFTRKVRLFVLTLISCSRVDQMINQKEKLQAWVTELLSLPMLNANQMFSIHQHTPSILTLFPAVSGSKMRYNPINSTFSIDKGRVDHLKYWSDPTIINSIKWHGY